MKYNTEGLTSKELRQATGAPFYVIDYLRKLNRLPILFPSTGQGDATVFHPDSIKIVIKHLNRKKRLLSKWWS